MADTLTKKAFNYIEFFTEAFTDFHIHHKKYTNKSITELGKKLGTRQYPFIQYLDNTPLYQSALKKLRKRNPIIFLPFKLKNNNFIPFSVRDIFDYCIALSFEASAQIKKIGGGTFAQPSKIELDKITKMAERMTKLMETSNPSIKTYTKGATMSLRKFNRHSRFFHRNFNIDNLSLIKASKNHAKIDREVLIKHMCHNYSILIGNNKVTPYKKNSNIEYVSSLPFENETMQKNTKTRKNDDFFSGREKNGNKVRIIHADIVTDLVIMITGDDDTTERKVYDLWKVQKEHVNNLDTREAFTINRLHYYARSFKF